MKKKILALFTCVCILFAAVACGGNESVNPTGGGGGGTAKGSLTIRLFDGGYGSRFIKDIAKAYESMNKGTKITVKTMVDAQAEMNKIDAGIYVGDLFISISSLYGAGRKGLFYDIDDVFASTPTGEAQTVEQKLGNLAPQFRSFNGHYYELPINDGMVGLVYNKTTLDVALGEGNWEEPNTSDELYALSNRLINLDSGFYPFVYSIDNNAEYQWWMTFAYLAQLLGEEAYYKLEQGYYYDEESGEYKFDLSGETIYDADVKKWAIEDVQRFNGGKMASTWCDGMDFAEAQAFFLGYGYGTKDTGKAAFMTNGDWIYNEMEYLISDDRPQDIRMMNFPVSSKILELTESVDNDAELSALITAIDAKSSSLTGKGYSVTQEDYDKVKEARSIAFTLKCQQVAGIPTTSKNPALARSFLTFFASDTAGTIYSSALHGDVSPFTKIVSGVTPNAFIKSKLDTFNNINDITYICSEYDTSPFHPGFYPSYYYYSRELHEGTALDTYNSETYRRAFLQRYAAAKVTAGIMG